MKKPGRGFYVRKCSSCKEPFPCPVRWRKVARVLCFTCSVLRPLPPLRSSGAVVNRKLKQEEDDE